MSSALSGIPRIFVSHSHYDSDFCRSFVANLRATLHLAESDHIFYDETSLHFGDQWLQRIQYEVLARPLFMVILTPRSVAANYVRQETSLALRETIEHRGRKLIPILVEECDPNELAPLVANFQMVDFVHRLYQDAFDDLIAFLQTESQDTVASMGGAASAPLGLSPEALRARALALETHQAVEAGRWSDAVVKGEFAQTLSENRADAGLYADLALAYAELGKWERAGETAHKALEMDSFRADLWLLRAKTFHATGHVSDAIEAIDRARAVTFLSDRAGHLSLLALKRSWQMELEHWADALDTLEQELALAPDDPMRVVTHVELLRRLGRPEMPFVALGIAPLPPVLDASQWPTIGTAQGAVASTRQDTSETPADGPRRSRFEQTIQQMRRALSGEG